MRDGLPCGRMSDALSSSMTHLSIHGPCILAHSYMLAVISSFSSPILLEKADTEPESTKAVPSSFKDHDIRVDHSLPYFFFLAGFSTKKVPTQGPLSKAVGSFTRQVVQLQVDALLPVGSHVCGALFDAVAV